MAETNTPGSLLVGEGVFMKGSMRVPGLASIDGKLEGELTADTVHIQSNGSMNGLTTASHVKVAGSANDTMIANKTLVIESTGMIAGSITYAELEIKKCGSLQGAIHKVGQKPQGFSAASPVAATATAPSAPSAEIPAVNEADKQASEAQNAADTAADGTPPAN